MSHDERRTTSERVEDAVRQGSRPSSLRVTDLRVAVVAANYDYPIIRIDTDQGVSGFGEVRDAGHASNALQFKSALVGQNPCNVDMIYRGIRHYGNWGREGGGVSGIEIALYDLIGKVYGVPCWQLLGGKYRDKVRLYGDTPAPENPSPRDYASAARARMELGLSFIKFDLRPWLFEQAPGGIAGTQSPHDYRYDPGRWFKAPGAGRGAKLTDKGIEACVDVVQAVRDELGWEVQLCVDHFGEGFLWADEVIRLGKALERFDLAWMEDPLVHSDTPGHRKVADALLTPIAAGENLYTMRDFRAPIEQRAYDIVHPDLLSAGGMMETKRISDFAEDHGIPSALHCAGSPIGFMANIHTAAAISSFLACEHHGLDLPFWNALGNLPEGYMADGYVAVPDAPGLGIEPNADVLEANLRTPGTAWLSTEAFDTPKLDFWRPDERWPE